MSRDVAAVKAATLTEALPYIRSWRGRTVVVKIGGAALDDPGLASVVADDIALLSLVGIHVVVVHGGGPQVTTAMRRAGIEPTFVDGLRVTDEAAMDIVRGVLAGVINPDLVARLSAAGIAAVGLDGADGGLLLGEVASAELGRVGSITHIEAGVVLSLIGAGFTPVVASIALDRSGSPLNVNADSVAGALAAALHAEKLVILTNVDGLYRDLGDAGSLVSELKSDELAEMLAELSAGMRPKAQAAVDTLRAGVEKVHILDGRVPHALLLEIFTDEGSGTQVLP